ncbi:hypothetical protein M0R01_00105 [bacterium]|nr:hypothetical protein [bacterium]
MYKKILILTIIFSFACLTNSFAATLIKGKCNSSYGNKLILFTEFKGSWVSGKGKNFCSSGSIYSQAANCVSYVNSIKCTYACMGNGGGNSVCNFYVKKENKCGSANGKSYAAPPNNNLCLDGSVASVVEDKNSSWGWSCKSYDGLLVSYCSASKNCFKSGEYVSGTQTCCGGLFLCPVSSGPYLGQCSERCSADCDSTYAPACGLDGKDYNNECLAKKFGGGLAYKGECKYNGAKCGIASEQNGYSLEDSANLCKYGNPSVVSGNGPWYWTCRNDTGSWAIPCFSTQKGSINGICGSSNGKVFKNQPSTDLCKSGTSSSLSSGNAWYWTCNGSSGGEKSYCYAAREGYSANGVCAGISTNYTSQERICQSGYPEELKVANGQWKWRCSGINGGVSVDCSGNFNFYPFPEKYEQGKCGASSGIVMGKEPTTDFCISGYFKDFKWDENSKEWRWICSGKGGASSENCGTYYSSNLIKANGLCGTAAGGSFNSAPMNNLCSKGSPSVVTGTGPWNWTCSGISGGNSANCSAKKVSVINGSCGSSAKSGLSVAPTSNLCLTGEASSVSGAGPWYWTCFGSLGGKDVQCTAKTSEVLTPRPDAQNFMQLETILTVGNQLAIKVSLKDYGVKVFVEKGKAPYKNNITPDNPKDNDFMKTLPSGDWVDSSIFILPEKVGKNDTFCFDAWYKPEWENGKLSSASQFYSDCISLSEEYPIAPKNLEVKLYPINIGGAIVLASWEDYKDTKNHPNRYSTVIIRTKGISPYYPDTTLTSSDQVIGSSCLAKGKGCPQYDIVSNGNQKNFISYITKGNYCYTAWTRYCNGYYCYNSKTPTYWCFEVK